MEIVYFSNVSENTHRFVEKVGGASHRLPLRASDETTQATKPYVLVVPTYGGGHEGGAIPRPVIRFLNNKQNRELIRGVVSSGNTNFGDAYCKAGRLVSEKVNTPVLMEFELTGMPEDVRKMREILNRLEEEEHDTAR
jgi:protein involved in ribonucleotide reduction